MGDYKYRIGQRVWKDDGMDIMEAVVEETPESSDTYDMYRIRFVKDGYHMKVFERSLFSSRKEALEAAIAETESIVLKNAAKEAEYRLIKENAQIVLSQLKEDLSKCNQEEF